MTSRRLGVALLGAVAGAVALAPSAQAAIPTAFGTQALTCNVQATTNYRLCSGVVNSFDGAPIDVRLLLPAEPGGGATDGDFPLAMGFHGWGGSKADYDLERWVDKGYAAFTMSDRGWGMSCGGPDPKRLTPACTGLGGASLGGYNHLMDTRFEVRDAQEMAGLLADDGIVDPDRIGATGGSYGGGISMALAALNDRKMLPDGSLVPWTSPGGKAMHIAAAAPEIPWTDLANSLVPNGYTLDYVSDSPYDRGPIGVLKQSFVAGLFDLGLALSNYAPPTDASANVPGWYALLNAGEPYEGNPLAQQIVDEVTKFHSSYYIDHSRPPSPLMISNGWTDDLFPADEAIRFYNRTRDQYPDADISLFFFDHGHQRALNKRAADEALLDARQEAWFDHYVKGGAAKPPNQVETLTQPCPDEAASDGPFTAASWLSIAPGEVRFEEAGPKTIAPTGGNPQSGQAFDPISGPGPCATAPAADAPGLANYRLDEAPKGGFTLMGSPTVVADIVSQGPTSQIASRLVDVDPETGDETLVARGLYRPRPTGATAERVVFQLHPNGYLFKKGHVAKLELMPSDTPYGRVSNGQAPVTVSNLDLRLPVLEAPGSTPVVTDPVPKFVPPGSDPVSELPPGAVDSDGDAVADPDDRCVNRPGPASNDGCPLPKNAACATVLRGTTGKDMLKGTSLGERLLGRKGSDRIKGKGGADCLIGNGGRDRLTGGSGKDKLTGGAGGDRIYARDGERDVVVCGSGRDRVKADRKDKVRKSCERVTVSATK